MKRLKMSFVGSDVKPGEVVVIRPAANTTLDEAKSLCEAVQKCFPDNKVFIIRKNDDIQSYDKAEFMQFLDELRAYAENLPDKIEFKREYLNFWDDDIIPY